MYAEQLTMNKNSYLYQPMDKVEKPKIVSIPSSFELAFKTNYEALVRYGKSIIKDIEDAEDIVQSVYLDLWKEREKVLIETEIKAYLYRGVYFKCMNRLQHEKVKSKFQLHIQRNESNQGRDLLVAQELEDQIQATIASLPDQCRKIFSLSRFEQKRYKDIAKELSISPKTVENQMGKALKILRIALTDFLHFIILIITIQL